MNRGRIEAWSYALHGHFCKFQTHCLKSIIFCSAFMCRFYLNVPAKLYQGGSLIFTFVFLKFCGNFDSYDTITTYDVALKKQAIEL